MKTQKATLAGGCSTNNPTREELDLSDRTGKAWLDVLFFPVLLFLGLDTRFRAAVLFVFNIIAATSYPDLSEAGRMQHFYWARCCW